MRTKLTTEADYKNVTYKIDLFLSRLLLPKAPRKLKRMRRHWPRSINSVTRLASELFRVQ
jgi:hypothetical protein